jgi:hypothetical protein
MLAYGAGFGRFNQAGKDYRRNGGLAELGPTVEVSAGGYGARAQDVFDGSHAELQLLVSVVEVG